MRSGIWYTMAAALITLGVVACCAMLPDGAGRAGAWSGAGIAFAIQVTGFWLLFVWGLPKHPGLAHALGMLVRFTMLGVAALAVVPLLGLPAAPTLLALVAVLFLTTLSEPIVLHVCSAAGPGPR